MAAHDQTEVFLARPLDPKPFEVCIIKAYPAALSKQKSFWTAVASGWQKAKRLQHPGITTIYEIARVDDQLYVAQEYLAGQTLAQWIDCFGQENQKFPLDLAFYVAQQMAEALSYGHNFFDPKAETNVVCCHQRLCPANVLIGYNGRIKLLNYGTAVMDDYQKDPQKLAYMPPEFFTSDHLHAKSDQYGLGITLISMLLGGSPFSKLPPRKVAAAIKKGELPELNQVRADLTEEMVQMMMKLVHLNERLRFDNMQSVLRLVSQFVQKLNPGANEDFVGLLAQQHFKTQIDAERAWRGAFLDIDLAPFREMAPAESLDQSAPSDGVNLAITADSQNPSGGPKTFTRTIKIVQEINETASDNPQQRQSTLQTFKPVKKSKFKKLLAMAMVLAVVVGGLVALDFDAAKTYWTDKFFPQAQKLVKEMPPTWPERITQAKALLAASYQDYINPMFGRVFEKTKNGTQEIRKRLPASLGGTPDAAVEEAATDAKKDKAKGKDKGKNKKGAAKGKKAKK